MLRIIWVLLPLERAYVPTSPIPRLSDSDMNDKLYMHHQNPHISIAKLTQSNERRKRVSKPGKERQPMPISIIKRQDRRQGGGSGANPTPG